MRANENSSVTFFDRLRKRRLVQWSIGYLAGAWVLLQAAELLFDIFEWPGYLLRVLTIFLAFGLLASLILAWFHGERGQQSVCLPEVVILAVIIGSMLVTLAVFDFGTVDNESFAKELFIGQPSRRVTADTFYESDPSWAPDGSSLVYASQRSGNSDLWILQRDGSTTQLTFDSSEDSQPTWSSDGRSILFTSSRDVSATLDRSVFFGYTFGGGIWSIPAFGGEASRIVDDGFNPSWAPDSPRFAYDSSADGPRRIWIADASGESRNRLSADESDLAAHIRPSWSPSGQWIVYERQPGSQASAGALVLISSDGNESFQLTKGIHRDMAPAWANERTIVFASDRGGALNLWQLHVDVDKQVVVGEPSRITAGAGEEFDPAVASDGTLAYVTVRRLENLWQIDVDPQSLEFEDQPQRLMQASWNDFAPALSSDNSRTAFSSDRDGSTNIWIHTGGATEPEQMTSLAGNDLQPVWSPDDSRLAFFSDANGKNDIWVMPLNGSQPVAVTPQESNDVNPYWSPNGQLIAFTSDRSGQSEVWTMEVDGSDPKRLTDMGVLGHTARWSPDGLWLLFTSISSGDREVWAVSANGDELRRLTTQATQDAHGLWSADGKTVIYLSDHQRVYARPFSQDEHRLLFDLGEAIDYVHLSADGTKFLFTREQVESDIWLIE